MHPDAKVQRSQSCAVRWASVCVAAFFTGLLIRLAVPTEWTEPLVRTAGIMCGRYPDDRDGWVRTLGGGITVRVHRLWGLRIGVDAEVVLIEGRAAGGTPNVKNHDAAVEVARRYFAGQCEEAGLPSAAAIFDEAVESPTNRASMRVWWRYPIAIGFGAGPWVMAASVAGVVLSLLAIWRIRRREAMRGRCPRCGYDQIGLSGFNCPECGWIRVDGRSIRKARDAELLGTKPADGAEE